MFRWTLVCASVLSLLLCVAASVLWVRSYRASDELSWIRTDGQRVLRTAEGHLVLAMNLADGWGSPATRLGLRYAREPGRTVEVDLLWPLFLCSDRAARWVKWQWGEFAWLERRTNQGLVATGVAPLWSVTAATALPPTAWATSLLLAPRLRARRRLRRGLCPACGYDLRATPERCPECGMERTVVAVTGQAGLHGPPRDCAG